MDRSQVYVLHNSPILIFFNCILWSWTGCGSRPVDLDPQIPSPSPVTRLQTTLSKVLSHVCVPPSTFSTRTHLSLSHCHNTKHVGLLCALHSTAQREGLWESAAVNACVQISKHWPVTKLNVLHKQRQITKLNVLHK